MKNPLYAITDDQWAQQGALVDTVEALLEAGCRRIQYRDKNSDAPRRKHEASQLLRACKQHQAELIINDDVDLALAVGAHGVHLGQSDAKAADARRRLGPHAIIGITCHDSLALAQSAIDEGANYVAFGRFFPSVTKPNAPPAPLSLLTKARQSLADTPIVAIGGITLEKAEPLLVAGADWLAVSHDLYSAPDIRARCRAFAGLRRS